MRFRCANYRNSIGVVVINDHILAPARFASSILPSQINATLSVNQFLIAIPALRATRADPMLALAHNA